MRCVCVCVSAGESDESFIECSKLDLDNFCARRRAENDVFDEEEEEKKVNEPYNCFLIASFATASRGLMGGGGGGAQSHSID